MNKFLIAIFASFLVCFRAGAVTTVPESFSDLVGEESSIFLIHINKVEEIRQNKKLCGFKYYSTIKERLKGGRDRGKNFVFTASEDLSNSDRYVVFFSEKEVEKSMRRYMSSTGCIAHDSIFIWYGIGTRIFEIDNGLTSFFGEDIIKLDKYNFAEELFFIHSNMVPPDMRNTFKDSSFLRVKDLKNVIRSGGDKYK